MVSSGSTLTQLGPPETQPTGSQTGAATLTIYRMSESELRFRFRIDRVKVRSRGGSVVATIPMVVIFLLAQRAFVEGIATTGSKG